MDWHYASPHHTNANTQRDDGLFTRTRAHHTSDGLEVLVLCLVFYAVVVFLCILFIIDIMFPDAFAGDPSEEEEQLVLHGEKATERELQPLLPRRKGRVDMPAERILSRQQPFLPPAALQPWSVRYFDPEGREYCVNDVDQLLV